MGDEPIRCRGLLCQIQLNKWAAQVFSHTMKLFFYDLKSKKRIGYVMLVMLKAIKREIKYNSLNKNFSSPNFRFKV